MASVSPSPDRLPQNRSNKLTGPGHIKQANYRKNVVSNHKHNSGTKNNNNNAHSKQPPEYIRTQQRLNYDDTLDSAYSTSESSYNTVDSTYSQRSNSSGYSTLDLKWKRPQSNYLIKTKQTGQQDARPLAGSFDPDSAVKAFDVGGDDPERIKFVDDLDDSDTATETETDTELTLSGSAADLDMSYVPDYVRPVGAPISVVAMTSTTSSFTTSRPTLTSTMTSPSVSVSSSTKVSSMGYAIDENVGLSPKAASYKRVDRGTTYVGYREDYVRKQKEKLCGRKSLDERLKSLESGAAVRLQVCKGSQNRRRKPESREMVSTVKPMNSTTDLYSRCRSPAHDTEDGNTKQDLQIEPTPTRAPPPDIIESHQPPSGAQESQVDLERSASNKDAQAKLLRSIEPAFPETRTGDADSFPKPGNKPHPVAIKWKAAAPLSGRMQLPPHQQPGPTAASVPLQEDETAPGQNDAVKVETPQSPSRTEAVAAKLTWKQPSQEALNRLTDVAERPNKSSVDVLKTSNEQTPERQVEGGGLARGDEPAQQKNIPEILVHDTTVPNHAVHPVELRSPRGEQANFGRAITREKRNARMFAGPSSDDGESDNLLTRMKKPSENRHVHVAPVKFVPSVLRSRSRSARGEDSQSSSTSSLVADVKTATTEEGHYTVQSQPKDKVRRKSSRSPKRTNSKRSVRSKSTHDRPRMEKKKHARTLSSGSQSSVSVINSASDQRGRKSPETPIHNGSQRSRDQSSRSSPYNRYKTEYSELSNVQRTPHGHRKVLEAASLPSPRQLAVAQVVKFGFSGNEGAIPYIDENNSPEEQKKSLVEKSVPPPPAASEDLLRDLDSATIRKAFPLSRRGRSLKREEGPRRTSYMEAMGSSDDLTPDHDTDGSGYAAASGDSEKDQGVALGKFGRSNSADSILSTADALPYVVLRNKHVRASSEDRNSLKGVYRRSYQIATTKPTSKPTNTNAPLKPSSHKRQPSIRKLKNFFAENTQQMVESQAEEGRRGSRGRSVGPVPTLTLDEYDDTVIREGFLNFKVATIEKGKRTSAQKSWKLIWIVLKGQSLYLCKDWNRNKSDSSPVVSANTNSPGPASPPSQLLLEEEDPLNIQGSLVSIAYNYVKRKNVFKVTTCNGSEYLFQAEDRDEMLAWINSIQVSGNHDNKDGEVTINEDLILRKTSQIESGPKPEKRGTRKSRSPKPTRRMTVPIKDIDGSRRFKWRGSVNRIVRKFGQGQTLMQGGTFDVHLEDCPPSVNNELIPSVVDLCCRIVEERGLSFTGIYRVPGNSGTLAALQEELNFRGAEVVDLENDERFRELNVVSSLLKSFFRKLPDPLFTNELYDDFIAMNRKKDPEERINGLRRLIHMLPAPHYETLKFLISHLKKVADNFEVNKMEVRNLAIVFGPTLVRSSASDNMATMVTDMSDQCRIVESVLQHSEEIFCGEHEEIPTFLRTFIV